MSLKKSKMDTEEPKRCVLAYSGGLDTTVILCWLIEQGYEVICYLADVGQTVDNLKAIEAKALKVGAKKVYVEDLKHEFVTDYVFPLLRSTALYEGRYLLGTSIARPIITKRQVEIANKENCKYLAHGATGKGNDQVRFELSAYALDPTLEMIAPWRDPTFLARFEGRKDLLAYAAEHNVEVDQTPKASYSMDENLFHCSYESGILEDPACPPPAGMYRLTLDVLDGASDKEEKIRIEYKDGNPIKVINKDDGTEITDPLDLFVYLNKLGKKHGIGRIDIVENRYVGLKSRGCYDSPAATILFHAHLDIEGITMDREVKRLRDMLAPQFAQLAYNGYWFAPEMDFLLTALDKSQKLVDGGVDIVLYKGNVIITGRDSPYSRYNEKLVSMDEEGGYNPLDAQGFIRINALRLKAHRALLETVKEKEPTRLESFRFTE